jgi:predicted aminopeptidase
MKLLVFFRSARVRKVSVALVLFSVLLAVSGCRTFSFYSQAAKGQYELLRRGNP